MAEINPLRYRGYYYDTETGFYYLQSRYYDPVTHRFINADSIASTGQGFTGTNMFAYCGNNPVSRIDCAGRFWQTIYEIFIAPLADTAEVIYDIYDGSEDLLWDIISVAVDVYGYDLTADLLSCASVGDGVRQGTVLCLDKTKGKRHRTVPCPTNEYISQVLFVWDDSYDDPASQKWVPVSQIDTFLLDYPSY